MAVVVWQGKGGDAAARFVRMKPELTDRQAQILAYVKQYIGKFGYAPSMRAIGDRFDIAVNAVAGHLKCLERAGRIKRTPGLARAMVVVE